MTISSETNLIDHVGDGVSVQFSAPFYFLQPQDLAVLVAGTLQTLGVHYVVIGALNPAGGNVTFITPPGNGAAVRIVRAPRALQPVALRANDPFPPEAVERALDRLTMLVQATNTHVANLDAWYQEYVTLDFPAPAANYVIGWDNLGRLTNLSLPDVEEAVVNAAIAAALAQVILPTAAALQAANFAGSPTTRIMLAGYRAAGDGGAWTWLRVGPVAPAHGATLRSADGDYWEPARASELPTLALGIGPAGTANSNTLAWREAVKLLRIWGGGALRFPVGTTDVERLLITAADTGGPADNIWLRGMGRDLTTLRRTSGTAGGSFLYRENCIGGGVSDMTVSAGKAALGGAHGVQFRHCQGFEVFNLRVRDFDASAVSVDDSVAGPTGYYCADFAIYNIDMDGLGTGRNGVLLNNCERFTVHDITGGNMDLSGSTNSAPSIGVQLKTYCRLGTVYNLNLHTCRRGATLGSDNSTYHCRGWGAVFRNCVAGLGMFSSENCHFDGVTIYAPADENAVANPNFAGGCVTMRDTRFCSITGIAVNGRGNTYPPILVDDSTSPYLSVDVWRNTEKAVHPLMVATNTNVAITLDVNQYSGPGVVTPATLLTLSGGTTGTRFRWRGDRVLP